MRANARTPHPDELPLYEVEVGDKQVEVFSRPGRAEGRYCVVVYGEVGSALHWFATLAEVEAFVAGIGASEAT